MKSLIERIQPRHADVGAQPSFSDAIAEHGLPVLTRGGVVTLQINVGKLCNMACHHCHVDASPKRTEIMERATADRLIELLERNPGIETVDITGGAPELNANFRSLVTRARELGKHVIDRCNLTVLLEPAVAGVAGFLAAQRVHVIASLPCYTRENVESQRGKGAFDKSIQSLALLNVLGYGTDPNLRLDLVYNPGGAFLPSPQPKLEADYKDQLLGNFGVRFDNLLTLTNMPIKRFAESLARDGKHEEYMSLLVHHFNPATVDGLMCRSLISVSWDGQLYDCDFNQMLELPLAGSRTRDGFAIWDLDSFDDLVGAAIATDAHCFGCTARAGSSCSGALA